MAEAINTNDLKSTNSKEDNLVIKSIHDFQEAYKFQSKNIEEVREDYEFYLGKQWSNEKQNESIGHGQGKLTEVNNIRPYIHLLEGYQRQNRNDIIAFPEGDEDSIPAEIVTRLIKNTFKGSKLDFKISDMYKHACIGGAGYLYPYMDYERDLIFGELRFKILSGLKVFYDPSSEEYDMNDARYICLFKENLSKEDVKTLFPDFNVDEIEYGKISVSKYGHQPGEVEPYTKYYFKNNMPTNDEYPDYDNVRNYDMLEYFYKKKRNKYILINLENNGIIEGFERELIELKQKESEKMGIPTRLLTQRDSVVWRRVVIGDTIVEDKEAEFSDKWKGYPIIPFRAYYCSVDIKDKGKYQVQGVVRSMKEPQKEKNVARTHARRHILSSTNSGWIAEEKSLVNKAMVSKMGSKPGVLVEYKEGKVPPARITPMPLSQGFEFLSVQATEDLKQTSGINAELLSLEKSDQSGRALLLRQRQGLIMIQSLLDNLSQTTDILGRFLVSILPILYTPEKAINVLGSAFMTENFGVDQVQQDPQTGERVVVGQQIDQEAAYNLISQILLDKNITNYNIAVGEGVHSETVKFNNFLTLNELVTAGFPIPPDVVIDETGLANATKEKIKNSFKRQAEQQQ